MSTPLDEILTDIRATKARLKMAEDTNDTERITLWANLLIEQQKEKNIMLAALAREAPSAAGATYHILFSSC